MNLREMLKHTPLSVKITTPLRVIPCLVAAILLTFSASISWTWAMIWHPRHREVCINKYYPREAAAYETYKRSMTNVVYWLITGFRYRWNYDTYVEGKKNSK